MLTSTTIFYALAGGILPTFVWLWFWLQEDKLHPEPRRLIIITFVAGMLVVPLVIPFQLYISGLALSVTAIYILWALVEECLKFLAGYIKGIHSKEDDEPIDPVVYMITAALGFSAAENFLYLIDPITAGDLFISVATGNMRFVGATLLHVVASASVGVALGLGFYKKKYIRFLYGFIGILVAIALHSAFNLFIINSETNQAINAFYGVWIVILALLLFFEKIKRVIPDIAEHRSVESSKI